MASQGTGGTKRQPLTHKVEGRPGSRRSNPPTIRRQQRAEQALRARRRRIWLRSGLVGGAAVLILLVIFLASNHSSPKSSAYGYQGYQPGPGTRAPNFTLPSSMGGTFSLGAERGKTVLLYFQEGITCQPCWTQLQDIQHDMSAFHHAGIDKVVSITTNPLGDLEQAASTYGITIPVLSDSDFTVSRAYNANHGMMGSSADGHTFIVVSPTGAIEWRADYGAPPNYTMYVPVPTLLSQMRAGMSHYRAS